MIAITNSRFFKDKVLISDKTILINQGKIEAITSNEVPAGYEIIDAQNNYLSPGFIDLQIYGSGGNLFSAYPTVATLAQMDANLIQKGTTSFLACIATNSPEVVHEAIIAAKAYRSQAKALMGLHLEGPYLNAKRKGAHIAEFIKKASLDEIKALLDHGDGLIKMMTIAPELQDDAVIQYLLDNDVVLSMGHSDATFDQATLAYNKGISTTTHLFNAMPSIHHRAPNLPTATFNHPTAMASIIADGNHVDFEVLKMSQKIMQERLFLITDAVTACGIGPYQHQLDGDKFITPEGTLSGSNITMLQAVKNCVSYCDIQLSEAINMGSSYPAKAIRAETTKGKIAVGYDADLLLLSPDLDLMQVFKF